MEFGFIKLSQAHLLSSLAP